MFTTLCFYVATLLKAMQCYSDDWLKILFTAILHFISIEITHDPQTNDELYHKKISEILPLYSGIIVVLSNK